MIALPAGTRAWIAADSSGPRPRAARIIAFITDAPTVRAVLARLAEPTAPPRIAPAGVPPLWAAAGAERVDPGRQWEPSAQPEPAYEFDQRIVW